MKNNQLLKEFAHYLIPSVASLFSLSLYILADTFFIARGVGSIGLAALNIAIPAYSLINATGLLIGIGAGVIFSISRGQNNNEKANQSFNTAVCLALAMGILYTIVGVCFSKPIALLLGASEYSVTYSATYIRTMLSFSVFFLMNNTLNALVRNDGNPRLAMVSMITNSFSNVVFDYLFVIKFGWGMGGAALATGLSPILGLMILSLHWLKGKSSLQLERKHPNLTLTLPILRGGISNFIIEIGNGVVILLFNYTLMGLAGDIGVAAYGIVANVSLVISYIFIGTGQGMQPIISLLYGRGNMKDCYKILYMGLAFSSVLGILCLAMGLLFPNQITAIFNSEGDPYLAEMTASAIRIYFFSFLFMGVNICCATYFQSILQAKTASFISLLRGLILIVIGVIIFPRVLGITGVWLITPVAELCAALLCVYQLWSIRRRTLVKQPCTEIS